MSAHSNLRKAIAAAAVLLGLLWFMGAVVYPASQILSGTKESPGIVMILTLLPLMGLPAFLLIYLGASLFREMTEESLKWVVGTLAVFGAVSISARLQLAFPALLPTRVELSLGMFLGACVAVWLYLLVVRRLLPILGGEKKSMRSFLGRGILVLLAWLLWFFLSAWAEEYRRLADGYELVVFLVPMAVAYGSYRIAAASLLPSREIQGGWNRSGW